MKKRFTILSLLIVTCQFSVAQKYVAEKSTITFFSEAPVENIAAENKKSTALIDLSTSQIAFSIPINAFQFEKHLMQEHFNEKYMESEKYPKATFQGQIINLKTEVKGEQQVSAKGRITIHGVTNDIEVPGILELTPDQKIIIKATFKVLLKDYHISIPQILWQNIAEEIEVKLDVTFKPKL